MLHTTAELEEKTATRPNQSANKPMRRGQISQSRKDTFHHYVVDYFVIIDFSIYNW